MLDPQLIAAAIAIKPTQVTRRHRAARRRQHPALYRPLPQRSTGGLDEEQLRQLIELLEKLRALDERRAAILASIEEQGKLTPNCARRSTQPPRLTALEDLYLPYKPKRRTRASIAREKGLQPLADLILQQAAQPETRSKLAAGLPERRGADGRRSPGRGARHRGRDHQRPRRGAPRDAREGACSGACCTAEKVEDAEDEARVYSLYYDFEVARRPPAPAPGSGAQPRRERKSAAGST